LNINTHTVDAIQKCVSGITALDDYDVEYETIELGPNKTKKWLRSKGGLLFDPATKKPTRLVGIVRDITKEKAIELKAQQATAEAELANQTKNIFLANMSHETRTPLNSILGCLQLLQQDGRIAQFPTILENIVTAEESAKHLLVQMSDMIKLCNLDSKDFSLEMKDMPVRNSVDTVFQSMVALAEKKGLELVSNVDENVPEVIQMDSVQLRRIISNLINNVRIITVLLTI
jgi:signal transduction histidine kinase